MRILEDAGIGGTPSVGGEGDGAMPATVAGLMAHSHRALRVIRQNITASRGVKAVFVLLTILDPANLWTAIAADMGVSPAVVFNALRLLQIRDDRMITAETVQERRDGR